MVHTTEAQRWRPSLGACPVDDGFRFRVWAPARHTVDLVLDPRGPQPRAMPLAAVGGGVFETTLDDVAAGDVYAYRLDGTEGPFPDPASRSQPGGVHEASAIVDPRTFAWSDAVWRGVTLDRAVIYELHVGTFTPEGTFAGAAARLPALRDLGVTVVELMPVAQCAGSRNWGYDGAALFAPARAYGAPDDLRRFVEAAHGLGLAVMLDVVYNHFGPDGAYVFAFSPFFKSERHTSPWGAAVNLDGPHAAGVRAFFVENALHWLHEYHVDGLRLDATHALVDDGPRHLLRELTDAAKASGLDRQVLVVAEDDRNLAAIVRPPEAGGWGCDAVWADDFHHQMRRLLAGDRDGYFVDFTGTTADLAATMRHGWFFRGQQTTYWHGPRGTDPAGVPLDRMVICLQNHDQVGNRPFGDRLSATVDLAAVRAATAVLLLAPETPLLFMGQEWAATTPFLYFTDHEPELGRLVTEGRRREFARFEAFADPATRARIPDPQARSTFAASKLRWDERDRPPHAGMVALTRALLRLRLDASGGWRGSVGLDVTALDDDTIGFSRASASGGRAWVVARLRDGGRVGLHDWPAARSTAGWSVVMTTEDEEFAPHDAKRPTIDLRDGTAPLITFARAGAVLLRSKGHGRVVVDT